jgi:hypothetical protein
MHWLLGMRSTLSVESKLLPYEEVLKPITRDSLKFRQWNISEFPIKGSQVYTEYTLVYKQPQDPRRSKKNHSEIRKGSEKFLNKTETHWNALVVNLLDNTGSVNKLKRYSVLNLPDRFSKVTDKGMRMINKWTAKENKNYITGNNWFTRLSMASSLPIGEW